jgi:hypothetical protein
MVHSGTAIKMNHVFEIYVPSETQSGKPIPNSLRNETLAHVKKMMQEWFGGGTSIKNIPAEGFWALESGETADEEIDVVYSNANAAQFEEYRDDFFELASELANKLDQEAVACRIDGKMFIFQATDISPKPTKKEEIETIKHVQPRKIDKYRSIKSALLKLNNIDTARDLFCNVLHYEYVSDIFPTFINPANKYSTHSFNYAIRRAWIKSMHEN